MSGIAAWSDDDPWAGGATELMLVGPPGTGKTTSILRHYVWPALRADQRVLATSFTRAAARELRDRTGAELGRPPGTYKTTLSTLHSESSRRTRHLDLALGDRGKAAAGAATGGGDDDGETGIEPLDEAVARINADAGRAGLSTWDQVRQRFPGDIGMSVRDRLRRLLSGTALDEAEATVRRDLDGRLDDSGRLVRPDFTGSLELALVEGTDRELDLLVVDEVQDCTSLQWALVDRWATTSTRLLVVGDPDQAIYGWSGADGRRMLEWLREGRPARCLAQSYRVPRAAHALARVAIRGVSDRVEAPYRPAPREGRVTRTDDPADAWGLASDAAGGGKTVLVLARTLRGCATAAAELLDADLPHLAERGHSVLGTADKPSRAVRLASALNDCLSTGRHATTGKAEARVLCEALRASHWPMPRGAKLALSRAVKELADDEQVELRRLAALGLPVAAIADAWADPDAAWWRDRLTGTGCPDVRALLTVRGWVLEHGDADSMFAAASRLVVTTVHGAKGREADLVVVDARGCWRAWSPSGTPADRDEDRRVMYVALTRTREHLVLLRAREGRDWLAQQGM